MKIMIIRRMLENGASDIEEDNFSSLPFWNGDYDADGSVTQGKGGQQQPPAGSSEVCAPENF